MADGLCCTIKAAEERLVLMAALEPPCGDGLLLDVGLVLQKLRYCLSRADCWRDRWTSSARVSLGLVGRILRTELRGLVAEPKGVGRSSLRR